MNYVVPKSDQKLFEGHIFFTLTLPAEAKLVHDGNKYIATKIHGLRLTPAAIGDWDVKTLRAVTHFLLQTDGTKMKKKELVTFVLEHIKLEE